MANISGTAGNDMLVGTSDDDLIEGLGGDDTLRGGIGNDRLEGGTGSDSMNGGEGNDLLIGGDDGDTLYDDTGGNDQLDGGAGSDDIRIWRDAGAAATVNRMDGGAGNDFLGVYDESHASTFNISGGDGNDHFWIRGGAVVAIDAGAGDDWIQIEGLSAAVSVALGSGGTDRVTVNGQSLGYTGGSLALAGFDTGDGGDSLDIVEYLNNRFSNWDYRANPFATGHLRLVQNGADAVLQVDWDGGGDGYVDFVSFTATSAASLTAFNLGGWPSDGSIPAGLALVGDAVADDKISGGAGDDFIQGLGGADDLRGGAGDDHLDGGSGNDSLYGGLGDDLIEGGDGDDSLNGDLHGADVLRGGEGNDSLSVARSSAEAGWIELDGGGGDDFLSARAFQPADNLDAVETHFRLTGGTGADIISIYRATEVVVDAGAGDDLVDLDTYTNALITLGAGSDTLKLDELRGFVFTGRTITITDFEAGADGDRLDWSAYLADALPFWDGSTNPFPSFLRLVQSGDDTLVQISTYGDPAEFHTLMTLENVDSSALAPFNFGGFPPDGSPPVGEFILGTENADQITGGAGGDSIYGLGGDDMITGSGGDDFLYGGSGTDHLVGGLGNDRLEGGGDMDFLEDRSGGNDSLYGGDGRDVLYVERSSADPSTLLLDGGADGDWLQYIGQQTFFLTTTLTMIGGEGDDEFTVNGRVVTATIDGGTGDDLVILYTDPGQYDVTLGAGSDEIELRSDRILQGTINVTDFQTGASGDRLDLNPWFSSALTGWDGAQSPFTAGYARLVESGGSTLLQVDRDGGGDSYVTLLTLSGVSLFFLTAANLGGFDLVTKGTTGADEMRGGAAADLMHAGPGNDILLLQDGGDDTAYGGDGNDTIYFGTALSAGDVADGGAGRDSIVLQGNVTVVLTDTNLVGIESISIQSGANTKFGDTANNFYDYDVTTADGNVAAGQQLIVNAQSLRAGEDFTFDGSAEHDGKFLVYAGHGVDTLKGGDGNDIFLFEGTRWGASDTVDGGAGRDSVVISGVNGVNHFNFAANSFTSIESISLNNHLASDPSQKPSYELVLNNGNVAAGATLIVNGNSLADPTQTVSIDGSGIHDGKLILFGGAGNDVLKGGDGADQIQGGLGADALTGGAGADIFRYVSTAESTGASTDHILDFISGTDKIDLHLIDADGFTAGDQAFHWIGSDAFAGTGAGSAGELRAYESGGNWFVEGDINGDGTADLVIQLTTPAAPVVQGDFLL